MRYRQGLAMLAVGAVAATGGAATATADGHGPLMRGTPDAAIFASNNTATITDPADPRLGKQLNGFARKVTRIIHRGGGVPRGSQLLDGVFFSSDSGTTTFERSREFAVDDVTDAELHAIAEEVRVRFGQQSVLTFDHLPDNEELDAFEVQIPGLDATRLREGLLANPDAAARLFGGSVTLDGRLVLIAELADFALVRAFVTDTLGADFATASFRFGDREFVG